MKTAGMIGGLGPESTVDYYKMIIARWRERKGNKGYPEFVISSLDVDKGIELVDGGRLGELAEYLLSGVEKVALAGADFGFFAANTPHIVFDEVQRRSSIPLISIVKATADRVKKLGLKRVGLFGTGFTMRGSFFPEEFRRAGIGLVAPREPEIAFIHEKYLGELLIGEFLAETRAGIMKVAQRMKAEEGVEAIVLAGTELPLLLREAKSEVQLLDTTEIHVEAVVDELLR